MSDLKTTFGKRVEHAFGKRTFRSAYIIDDEFPTYAKAVRRSGDADSRSRELAAELHDVFRREQIPCDIDDWKHDGQFDEGHFLERVRKSDFIILDYNLRPNDIRTSIGIITKLADSEHFNNVLVYTANRDLQEVWRQVAAAARGGWLDLIGMARKKGFTQEETTAFSALEFPELGSDVLELVITNRRDRAYEEAEKELIAGLPRAMHGHAGSLLNVQAEPSVRELLGDDFLRELSAERRVSGSSGATGGVPWLQVGNCFVAFATKPTSGSRTATPAEAIFETFHAALRAWNPSAVQVAVAEVQNQLELNALATDMKSMNNPKTQAALSDYVLEHLTVTTTSHAEVPGQLEHVYDGASAAEKLLTVLVDNVRAHLESDADLHEWIADLLEDECASNDWNAQANRVATAQKMARVENLKGEDVRLKLNHMLAFEPVVGRHLTTGSLFRETMKPDNLWLCLTPACDMVPGRGVKKPRGEGTAGSEVKPEKWSESVAPYKPFMAARLIDTKLNSSSRKGATDGRYLFVDIDFEDDAKNGVMLALEVVNSKGVLSSEVFFAAEGGRVSRSNTKLNGTFSASRLKSVDNELDRPTPSDFEVIGQLRAPYANRLLQNMGQHLSRIGVDFINF